MSTISERLRRSAQQYDGTSPKAVANGSTAQMMYFAEDAKADIATLLNEIDRLTRANDVMHAALENIGVYGCGMLNQPAATNGPEETWLRPLIREYERVARAALNASATEGDA